ncbi:MAG: hypothetical protein AAGF12_07840 [Myxococcota bacterium]
MTSDAIQLGYSVRQAMGPSLADCHFLGTRLDTAKGHRPGEAESWILRTDGDLLEPVYVTTSWITGLWRSRSGVLFVCTLHGDVAVNPTPVAGSGDWRVHHLPFAIHGIWGLSGSYLWVYGVANGEPRLAFFDGRSFSLTESPGRIHHLHGLSTDFVYAVGADGLIARWNGSRFSRVLSPTDTTLSSVHVVSEDEIYACGADDRLLEGSVYGWSEVLAAEGSLFSVRKWNGRVWVAGMADGGAAGLYELQRNALSPIDFQLRPTSLRDNGDALLVSGSYGLAETRDGATFSTLSLRKFSAVVHHRRPLWTSEPFEDDPRYVQDVFPLG